jgi:NAD(P)-dependent dehydrogenase (short-subunit alcohol dehydrogenase family)
MQPALEGKTVINTSSAGALLTTLGLSGYQSSKTAIIRYVSIFEPTDPWFTEFLHAEYGKQGLRAFAYHPGGVPTELALNMPKNMHYVLTDKPALAGGYSVWLTTPAADFLKGRYSSCTWDIDYLIPKQGEIEEGNLLTCGITGLTAGPFQGF